MTATQLLIVLVTIIVHSNGYYGGQRYNVVNGIDTNYKKSSKILLSNNGLEGNVENEKVKVQVYYECLCPDCREFDSKHFKDTVIKIGSYLDIYTYPYGNAQTIERNGKYEFVCQHGPTECYGNKLHACAISLLKNTTLSVLYNACLMDESQAGRGSDDRAAGVCGQAMGINSDIIKACAKSETGNYLLKHYGEESKKANFNAVPYILINGVENDGDHFMEDVCKAFTNPPAACISLL